MSSWVQHRGLVLIAVFAGMATAAGVVLVQALRLPPVQAADGKSAGGGPAGPYAKPSAFGTTIAANSIAPDVKLSEPQIAQATNGSIVTVTGYDEAEKAVSQGIGYVYASSGMIITSYSAIRGASSVTVDTAKGEELNVIALMGYNVSRDLAALAVLEGNLPALTTGPAEVVQEGDSVVAVGGQGAVARATVGPRRALGGVDLIGMSAALPAGAPVLNEHGKVIGLARRDSLVLPSRYISDLLAEKRVLSFADMLRETGVHLTPAAPER